MDLSEYEYLWTTEKNDWVLVNASFGYGIVNKIDQKVLLVEDDELEEALVDQMLSTGSKIYDDIKAAYNDVPGGARFDEDVILCEKCGSEMEHYRKGSCCGATCPNCGWGWATTYIEPIASDDTDYHIFLSVPYKPSIDDIRMIAGISNCNYIEAKKQIENAPSEIFCGKAIKVREIREKLVASDIDFRIEPEYPY